jgi:nitrous oxidase accessory protein NosD
LALAAVFSLPVTCMAQAQSVTIEGGGRYEALSTALAAARPGDVLRVSGAHRGNFTIETSLTLSGTGAAALDGGGSGTVLRIVADDVHVEGLTISGSGRGVDPWVLWGDAGVRVEGDRAVLRGLDVSGNDWGVQFRGGAGTELSGSTVADNVREGVLIMGGAGHVLRGNKILRNRTGVLVDAFYGENNRVLVPLAHDPQWTAQVAAIFAAAVPARDHVIEDNVVRGNASTGILLRYHVRGVTVARNTVVGTGIERPYDNEALAFWDRTVGGAGYVSSRARQGSGIMLYCWPEETLIEANMVHDNLAIGIGLEIAARNVVRGNLAERNRVGVDLAAAEDNEIAANTVAANSEFGIRLGASSGLGQRPDGNLVHLNSMTGNGVNAFDDSGRMLSVDEIAEEMAHMPWPEEMRQVYQDPLVLRQMAQAMLAQQQTGANRWDDGRYGNHYDDFDEAAEGFVDRDGDGIGEVGRPVAGGSAVDGFPVTTAAREAAVR